MSGDVPQSVCSRCGTAFTCGMVAGQSSCWCAALPILNKVDPEATCLCPACLKQALDAQTAPAPP